MDIKTAAINDSRNIIYSTAPTEEITSVSRFAGSCSYLTKSNVKLPRPLVV